jgi:hypothetical protein
MLFFLAAAENVSDREDMPSAAACRANAADVELACHGRKAECPGLADGIDDRHNTRGESVRFGYLQLAAKFGGVRGIPPVPEFRPAGFALRQRGPRPLRDQSPLLLGQCSVEVQHNGGCNRARPSSVARRHDP